METKLLDDVVLSPRENRILEMLLCSGDVPIDEIYEQHVAGEEADSRKRQNHVGAIVSQINKKLQLTPFSIIPGKARRTYRLTQSEE